MNNKNPIEVLNDTIKAAKSEAGTQLDALRRERSTFEKTSFIPPENCTPTEFARAQAAHHEKGSQLRSRERNFDVQVLLDVDSNKPLLVDALAHVKAKYKEFKKSAKPSLFSNLRAKFGRPEIDDATPMRGHQIPPGGSLGKDIELTIEERLAIVTREVAQFPDNWTFARLAAELSAIDSAVTPQDKPEEPAPFPIQKFVQDPRF